MDRQCGSSQQALHFAAQAVASGAAELVVAGGVQNMSAVPIGSARTVGEQLGFPTPYSGSVGWAKRYGTRERVIHLSARGDDPLLMLTARIPATRHALRRAGLHVSDIDLFEVNEAFASVVLA